MPEWVLPIVKPGMRPIVDTGAVDPLVLEASGGFAGVVIAARCQIEKVVFGLQRSWIREPQGLA